MAAPEKDPNNGSGFTSDATGTYGDPNTVPTGEDNFSGWTWRQLLAAVTGGAAMEPDSDGRERAFALSDPSTLENAGRELYRAQLSMEMAAQSINDQAKALAGENGAWKGAAAEAFILQMERFAAEVKSRAHQLSGGASGLNNVPNQIYSRSADLVWAKNSMEHLDGYYASWAIAQGHQLPNGNAQISDFPKAVEQMTNQMREVATQLSARYRVTVNDIVPVDVTDFAPTATDIPASGNNEATQIPPPPPLPDADPAALPEPAPDLGPTPDLDPDLAPGLALDQTPDADGLTNQLDARSDDAEGGPDTFGLDNLAAENSFDGAPDAASWSGGSLERGTLLPDPQTLSQEPFSTVALTGPDGLEQSGLAPADAQALAGLPGFGAPAAVPGRGSTPNPATLDDDAPPLGLADGLPLTPGTSLGGMTGPPGSLSVSAPGRTSSSGLPSAVGLSAGGGLSSDGGLSSGGGLSSPGGYPTGGPLPSSPGLAPVSGPVSGTTPVSLSADRPGTSTGGGTGSPMLPPMAGGAPGSPTTDRSDSSGLLEGEVAPWQGAEMPSGADVGGPVGAAAGSSASWAPEAAEPVGAAGADLLAPESPPLTADPQIGTGAGPGPGAGGMVPPMAGGGAPGSPTTDRSDASGLLEGDAAPWQGAQVPLGAGTGGAEAGSSASWAPVAAEPVEARPVEAGLDLETMPWTADSGIGENRDGTSGSATGGGMVPPMAGGGAAGSPTTDRSDASGLLEGEIAPWAGDQLVDLPGDGVTAGTSMPWALAGSYRSSSPGGSDPDDESSQSSQLLDQETSSWSDPVPEDPSGWDVGGADFLSSFFGEPTAVVASSSSGPAPWLPVRPARTEESTHDSARPGDLRSMCAEGELLPEPEPVDADAIEAQEETSPVPIAGHLSMDESAWGGGSR